MKVPVSAGHLAVALLSLSPAVSAIAWPRWLPELDSLIVRADESSSSNKGMHQSLPYLTLFRLWLVSYLHDHATYAESPSPTPTPSGSSSQSNSKSTTSTPISTNLNTGGITKSGATITSGKATGNGTTTKSPKKTEFNLQDPAGGVVMVTPAVTAGSQLYKISDYVTWGWNYTNLQANPTAIDLYLKCSKVPQPWTLTQNMSWAEVGAYTWDSDKFQKDHVSTPLLTEQYTLVIADADGGISATAEPGYLAPYSGFTFGLYEKQDYHDTDDGWQCASCSGAASGMDRRAVNVAVAMSAVTVLSFTWFVSGFGAFL